MTLAPALKEPVGKAALASAATESVLYDILLAVPTGTLLTAPPIA